jgi:hypothetical protein
LPDYTYDIYGNPISYRSAENRNTITSESYEAPIFPALDQTGFISAEPGTPVNNAVLNEALLNEAWIN